MIWKKRFFIILIRGYKVDKLNLYYAKVKNRKLEELSEKKYEFMSHI